MPEKQALGMRHGLLAVNEDENNCMELWGRCGAWVALVGQGSRNRAPTGGSLGRGTGDRGREGRKVQMSVGARPGAAGPGKGEGAQMSPFCPEMHGAAAGGGCKHSAAHFRVPRVPWGSFGEEGMVSRPHLTYPGLIPAGPWCQPGVP